MSTPAGGGADQQALTHRVLRELTGHGDSAKRLVRRGWDAYCDDEMLQLAAESILIRAGEAVARLERVDPTFIDRHPEFELRNLRDARNVVAHGYDIVDHNILWEIL